MAKNVPALPEVALRQEARAAIKEIEKNPDLFRKYQEISTIITENEQNSVIAKWHIGKHIDEVLSDDRKYGDGSARKLADALMIDETYLYKYRDVATIYTLPQIKKLLKERSKKLGRVLTISHLIVMASVPSEALREKLHKRFLSDGITVQDMNAMVQAELGSRTNNKGGKIRVKGPLAVTAEVLKKLAQFVQVEKQLDDMLLEPLHKSLAEHASGDLQDMLNKAVQSHDETINLLQDNRRKLQAASDQVSRVLRSAESEGMTAGVPQTTAPRHAVASSPGGAGVIRKKGKKGKKGAGAAAVTAAVVNGHAANGNGHPAATTAAAGGKKKKKKKNKPLITRSHEPELMGAGSGGDND